MQIYTLHEPDTGAIRYVGITSATLKQRLWRHLSAGGDHYRGHWIERLKRSGARPVIKPLFLAAGKDEACVLERWFIASCRYFDFSLVNTTSGGDGFYKPTPEVSRKKSESMRKVTSDPAYRARMSANAKKHASTPEARASRAATALEKWKNPDRRAMMSVTARERWADPAFKARVSATQTARWAARRAARSD